MGQDIPRASSPDWAVLSVPNIGEMDEACVTALLWLQGNGREEFHEEAGFLIQTS